MSVKRIAASLRRCGIPSSSNAVNDGPVNQARLTVYTNYRFMGPSVGHVFGNRGEVAEATTVSRLRGNDDSVLAASISCTQRSGPASNWKPGRFVLLSLCCYPLA